MERAVQFARIAAVFLQSRDTRIITLNTRQYPTLKPIDHDHPFYRSKNLKRVHSGFTTKRLLMRLQRRNSSFLRSNDMEELIGGTITSFES